MIYICIPAHNEERTIGVLLWKVRQVMAGFPRDYQILVANDGSTDNTSEVLAPYLRVLPLTVINVEERSGYATALELLVREAVRRAEYPKRDVIVTLQADFSDDPDEVQAMLKRIEAGADIVVANAELAAGSKRALRWSRALGNFMLRRRTWPEGVNDPLCGLRAYRLIVLKRALEGRTAGRLLTWDGWAANAELLHLAQPHSRRTDAVVYQSRSDRQQRPSRLALWPALSTMVRYAQGRIGPLVHKPLPSTSVVDLRDRRRPARVVTPDEETRRPSARSRTASPQQRSGTRGPGRSQPERTGRPARGERATRPSREAGAERPAREPRDGRERPARQARDGRERPARARRPAGPRSRAASPVAEPNDEAPPVVIEAEAEGLAAPPARRKRRRKRRTKRAEGQVAGSPVEGAEDEAAGPDDSQAAEGSVAAQAETEPGLDGAPRKRRSRRGGRGRRGRGRARNGLEASTNEESGSSPPSDAPSEAPGPASPDTEAQPET